MNLDDILWHKTYGKPKKKKRSGDSKKKSKEFVLKIITGESDEKNECTLNVPYAKPWNPHQTASESPIPSTPDSSRRSSLRLKRKREKDINDTFQSIINDLSPTPHPRLRFNLNLERTEESGYNTRSKSTSKTQPISSPVPNNRSRSKRSISVNNSNVKKRRSKSKPVSTAKKVTKIATPRSASKPRGRPKKGKYSGKKTLNYRKESFNSYGNGQVFTKYQREIVTKRVKTAKRRTRNDERKDKNGKIDELRKEMIEYKNNTDDANQSLIDKLLFLLNRYKSKFERAQKKNDAKDREYMAFLDELDVTEEDIKQLQDLDEFIKDDEWDYIVVVDDLGIDEQLLQISEDILVQYDHHILHQHLHQQLVHIQVLFKQHMLHQHLQQILEHIQVMFKHHMLLHQLQQIQHHTEVLRNMHRQQLQM